MAESGSDEALRAKGLAALKESLGPIETLKFLALISREPFDYQQWRDEHFRDMSLDDILEGAKRAANR